MIIVRVYSSSRTGRTHQSLRFDAAQTVLRGDAYGWQGYGAGGRGCDGYLIRRGDDYIDQSVVDRLRRSRSRWSN